MTSNYRPQIEPVPAGEPRPKWSVMIPTYHCAHYLDAALKGVLAQDPGREWMQIEVVDDCSSDDPEAVVARFGNRVTFHRQPRNVGHIANFNTCLARARGELVHILHGDDAVRPGFYPRFEREFDANPTVGAVFCRFISIDGESRWVTVARLVAQRDGVVPDFLERIAVGQMLQPPCVAVRRDVYERLGGFDSRIERYGEDWEMWTRIAAHYPVSHVVEPLALYRVHDSSLSSASHRSGQNVRDLRRVIAINREALPAERRDTLTREALEVTALTAIHRARRLLAAGDAAAARAQAREALRACRSPPVLERVAELAAVATRRSLLHSLNRFRRAG